VSAAHPLGKITVGSEGESNEEAFRRDNPNTTVQFLNTGHFALETHVEEIAAAMLEFLAGSRVS